MIDREHKLPIKRQAEVLSISRGAAYYEPRPVPERDLLLMRKIDELHLNHPFAGSRMLRDLLRQQGIDVGRLHVKTLMKKMGIEAIYRRPNTSKPAPGHRICGHTAQPGLGDGHQLHPDGTGLRLPRRRGGLVQPPHPELEAVDHNGCLVLPRSG
jgi:hypothetical protein